MNSYLVKASDGECYLWEDQEEILYKLGRTRSEIQGKLMPKTIWRDVEAIDPHEIREVGKQNAAKFALFQTYMDSLEALGS